MTHVCAGCWVLTWTDDPTHQGWTQDRHGNWVCTACQPVPAERR